VGFLNTPNFTWEQYSFRKDRSFPAFTNFSLNHVRPDSNSYYNLGIEWSCPWNDFAGDITDETDLYEIALRLYDPAITDFETIADSGSVDVTLRRLQRFTATPGRQYSWRSTNIMTGAVSGAGTVNPDAHGLLTIPGVPVSKDGNRLRISGASTPVEQTHAATDELTLQQAPNPFSSGTTIRFSLPARTPVELAIFDAHGRRTTLLVSCVMNPGMHTVTWSGDDDAGTILARGWYYVQLRAGSRSMVRRALFLR
jgi:hypothetical protein